MPIYEFVCEDCGHRFSRLYRTVNSGEEVPAPPCESCHSAHTRRAISQFAVQGPGRADPAEMAARRATQKRLDSTTPKEQIDKWRATKA